MSVQKRTRILTELARHTGKRVSAAFVYRTVDFIPEIERFHNLITGIYKPAWSAYALSIVMKLSSPYSHKDEVIFLEDGRWLMTYSPRAGGLDLADNRALVKCMEERVPLGVFRQLTDKTKRQPILYLSGKGGLMTHGMDWPCATRTTGPLMLVSFRSMIVWQGTRNRLYDP
jgi:hypothetical protein